MSGKCTVTDCYHEHCNAKIKSPWALEECNQGIPPSQVTGLANSARTPLKVVAKMIYSLPND